MKSLNLNVKPFIAGLAIKCLLRANKYKTTRKMQEQKITKTKTSTVLYKL